ncbi:hypothetical protein L2E82_48428 [Cichorium intybus]|uniref:Uncharacterized protein n=1 Tax=Cichorium intybus TaxID=13427 RepID=A0ACB8YXB4_CICIN|nr:hypothetical protein L2E82_48428 [Cichorium intybus]
MNYSILTRGEWFTKVLSLHRLRLPSPPPKSVTTSIDDGHHLLRLLLQHLGNWLARKSDKNDMIIFYTRRSQAADSNSTRKRRNELKLSSLKIIERSGFYVNMDSHSLDHLALSIGDVADFWRWIME